MAVSSHINNVQPTTNIINKKCTNVHIIRSTTEGELHLPMLPSSERQTHILLNIKHSLVSIGELCNTGSIFTFRVK